MIPKVEIRYSLIYNKVLNLNLKNGEFNSLKEKSKDFEKLFHKHINQILKIIQEENEDWQREYISVYIVKANKKSFSDPLTLRYREDYKLMLLVLIHELIHNNFKEKFRDFDELHKKIDSIFRRVIGKLKLENFEEALEKYYKFN